ncbi:MAG: Chaperone required for the assembly of the mitochondrial F1-ATPase [Rhodospirillales bacterium]|nr:Chaperone required for the assembly of the mitochondrial F1-ATPase [Rhodospirillales bacterium]
MKRFYKEVQVIEGEGFGICLDGKAIKTPRRTPILVPGRRLAEAIAMEWRAQETEIRPHTMPMMQLAATVIDHFSINRPAVEATILRFAETDTVCYRAEPGQPAELIALQRELWDPLLAWLAQHHGATLVTTSGILPVKQSGEAMETLARTISAMDDWRLGAFQCAAASSGSFVIGLALVDGRIDADEAISAAELDSGFEIDRWGEDGEATARRAVVASDLTAARRFRDLLGP